MPVPASQCGPGAFRSAQIRSTWNHEWHHGAVFPPAGSARKHRRHSAPANRWGLAGLAGRGRASKPAKARAPGSPLLQPPRLGLGKRLVGKVAQRRPPPQPKRLSERPAAACGSLSKRSRPAATSASKRSTSRSPSPSLNRKLAPYLPSLNRKLAQYLLEGAGGGVQVRVPPHTPFGPTICRTLTPGRRRAAVPTDPGSRCNLGRRTKSSSAEASTVQC